MRALRLHISIIACALCAVSSLVSAQTEPFQASLLPGVFNTPENFDRVVAPALPSGWAGILATGLPADIPWQTVTTQSVSAPNSAFATDYNHVTDNRLESAPILSLPPGAILTFRNNFNVEQPFDGMVLEISINGGAFTDIITAGGTFVTGGYTGTIFAGTTNPLQGRPGWTGNSAGFITTQVNLPAAAFGQNVRFRWRLGTDASIGVVGCFIDNVELNCTIVCPANITVGNDHNQCGAIVNFTPATTGACGTIVCAPASGSLFPVGETTVTCSTSAGASCEFNVTVRDVQPPSITCPTTVTAITLQPRDTSAVVRYTSPTASDNCPGVVAFCTPDSGATLPLGETQLVCTAIDLHDNMSTCTSVITVFDASVQDDNNPANELLFNTFTGEYRFCCNGTTYTGIGSVSKRGRCNFFLKDREPDRKVDAQINICKNSGKAKLKSPRRTLLCNFKDSNILNNTPSCQ